MPQHVVSSKHIGVVGQPITANVIVKGYIRRKTWGEDRPTIFLLEDKDGNIITIQSSFKLNVGQRWAIEGNVKNHGSFNGQKQSHLDDWSLMITS